MNTKRDPKEIAESMMHRSRCNYQVGACIEDKSGRVISWGWNSEGKGFGIHAEAHAILRGNPTRMRGGILYVASRRKASGNIIYSKPCLGCQILIQAKGISKVYWREAFNVWRLWTP